MRRSLRRRDHRRSRSPIVTARDRPETFEAVFLAYWDQVLRFLLKRTFDPEAAFDLTAETFTAMLANIRDFRGETEASGQAWMYTIARNQLSKWYQSGEASRTHRDRLQLELRSPAGDELERIEELADMEPVRRLVQHALATIHPEHRRLLEMRVVDEWSYDEVATSLQISKNAARIRVARALASLEEAIAQLADDDESYRAAASSQELLT